MRVPQEMRSGAASNPPWGELLRMTRFSSDGILPVGARTDLVSPLAGLLVLRWTAFVEAESEAVSAFDATPFRSALPDDLKQSNWTDSKDLPARLRSGLLQATPRHDSMTARYVQIVAPIIGECAERNPDLFAVLVRWVADLPFESAQGRDATASAFEELLADAIEPGGGIGGEFTTPRHVVDLMVELVNPVAGDRVYDPCFGIGGLLVESARRLRRAVTAESLHRWTALRNNGVFGVEISCASFVIGLCRVVLAGIDRPGLEIGDALERPLPVNRAAEGFDCILAAPPWGGHLSDTTTRQYPVPTGRVESLFLQHVMASLRPGGRAVIALPEATLFRTGADRRIRKLLLDEYRVDGIIALPEGAFAPSTAVPSSLVVFRRELPRTQVRFINIPANGWGVLI